MVWNYGCKHLWVGVGESFVEKFENMPESLKNDSQWDAKKENIFRIRLLFDFSLFIHAHWV